MVAGNSVTVTGLTAGDVYYYKVFEYNGSSAPVYNTTAVLSGSIATGTLPVTWLYFNATQKSDKVVLNWGTSARNEQRLVYCRKEVTTVLILKKQAVLLQAISALVDRALQLHRCGAC